MKLTAPLAAIALTACATAPQVRSSSDAWKQADECARDIVSLEDAVTELRDPSLKIEMMCGKEKEFALATAGGIAEVRAVCDGPIARGKIPQRSLEKAIADVNAATAELRVKIQQVCVSK